jgi:hypothetical protein
MSAPVAAEPLTPGIRAQFTTEILQVLAKLRIAREVQDLDFVMVAERRMNWLIEQLRPN